MTTAEFISGTIRWIFFLYFVGGSGAGWFFFWQWLKWRRQENSNGR